LSEPLQEWLSEYSSKPRTQRLYESYFNKFCSWAKVTDRELVEEYERSKEREFAKKWGRKAVQFYNHIISEEKKSINTARSHIIAVRSFFNSQCTSLKIKRGAISSAKMATGEHEFLLSELQKMYSIGDIQDKARLSLAVSLGWGASDYLSLKWDFIESYLAENLEPPVAFWFERGKTAQPIRAHLTHECIESLRQYREINDSAYVTSYKTIDALNDWLRSLCSKAKIQPRGQIRFHLLRKFLFTALVNSGMSEIHAKICIGKKVPISDLTYLQSLAPVLREGFMNAHHNFALTCYTNKNHSTIKEMSNELQELRNVMRVLAKYTARYAPTFKRGMELSDLHVEINEEDLKILRKFFGEKDRETREG